MATHTSDKPQNTNREALKLTESEKRYYALIARTFVLEDKLNKQFNRYTMLELARLYSTAARKAKRNKEIKNGDVSATWENRMMIAARQAFSAYIRVSDYYRFKRQDRSNAEKNYKRAQRLEGAYHFIGTDLHVANYSLINLLRVGIGHEDSMVPHELAELLTWGTGYKEPRRLNPRGVTT